LTEFNQTIKSIFCFLAIPAAAEERLPERRKNGVPPPAARLLPISPR
jgi:hypothetical protein